MAVGSFLLTKTGIILITYHSYNNVLLINPSCLLPVLLSCHRREDSIFVFGLQYPVLYSELCISNNNK